MYTKLQPNNIRSDLPIIPVIYVKEEEWEGEHTGESCDGDDESKGDITDGNEWLTVEEAVLRNDATCNNINKKFMLNRNMIVYHGIKHLNNEMSTASILTNIVYTVYSVYTGLLLIISLCVSVSFCGVKLKPYFSSIIDVSKDESIPFQAQVQKYIYGSRLFSCCLFLFVGGENLLPLLSTGWLQNGFEHGVDKRIWFV